MHSQRLPGLDLLRAAGIILVMFYHASLSGLVPTSFPLARFGWMGVDIFFALSGFLIGSQLFRLTQRNDRMPLSKFYLRRTFRTLPAYWATLTLMVLVPTVRDQPDLQPLWQCLLFIQNIFVTLDPFPAFTHGWSLCVEEQFYLIIPFIIILLSKRMNFTIGLAVVLVIFALGMILRYYLWQDIRASIHPSELPAAFVNPFKERIYFPTLPRLDGLLAGVAFAAVYVHRPTLWHRLTRSPVLLMVTAGLAITLAVVFNIDRFSMVASVFGFPLLSLGAALLVAAGTTEAGIPGCRLPGISRIAILSYSLYLVHEFGNKLATTALSWISGYGIPALLISFGLAFVFSAAMYLCVELPAITLRKYLERKYFQHEPPVLA